MSLGFEGALGANEFQKALRQQILDHLAQQQQAFQNSMATRGADRADRALSQQDTLTRLKIQEMADSKTATENDKAFTQAEKANEAVPAGTVFPSIDGRQSASPIIGRLSMVGALQPTAGSLGSTTDTPANLKTGTPPSGRLIAMPAGQVKLPSANQANVLADNARADRARMDAETLASQNEPLQEVVGANGKPTLVRRSQAQGMTPFVKPTGESTITIQTVDPTTGKPVTRVMTKADALKEGTFTGKTNAVTDNRLVSAKAVLQTGQDIKNAVTQNAAILGPLLSRYNNLEDFVGNPPPQFAKLAGQIESYSLANMGVHGMRANTGAEAIKQTIGLGRHTPESLLAVIDGLNGFAQHLTENEGRANDQTPTGPPAQTPPRRVRYGMDGRPLP